MKALSILDEVIATIRESKDKKDAKKNLVDVFQFTIRTKACSLHIAFSRHTDDYVFLRH